MAFITAYIFSLNHHHSFVQTFFWWFCINTFQTHIYGKELNEFIIVVIILIGRRKTKMINVDYHYLNHMVDKIVYDISHRVFLLLLLHWPDPCQTRTFTIQKKMVKFAIILIGMMMMIIIIIQVIIMIMVKTTFRDKCIFFHQK